MTIHTGQLADGAVALLTLAGLVALRHRPGRVPARTAFRSGPLWAWCPNEARPTPHHLDAGVRHCRVCKTTTTHDAHDDAGDA